jgi:hypothetical protein
MSDAIKTLSETEIYSVHTWCGDLFKSFGMTGDQLDQATATTFRLAWQAIDQHRLAKAQAQADKDAARSRLRVVK